MMLAPLVDAMAQVATPVVQLEIGKLMLAAIGVVLSVLGTAVIFFVKRLIASFDGFKVETRSKFAGLSRELVSHGKQVDIQLLRVRGELSEHSQHVDRQLDELSHEMQKVTHEMFGPNGDNGMRGDVRDNKRLSAKHGRILILLAHKAGVPYTEEED